MMFIDLFIDSFIPLFAPTLQTEMRNIIMDTDSAYVLTMPFVDIYISCI